MQVWSTMLRRLMLRRRAPCLAKYWDMLMSTTVAAARPVRARTRGPVEFLIWGHARPSQKKIHWSAGLLIEIAGTYTPWKDEGVNHARRMVAQIWLYYPDLRRLLLIDDTPGPWLIASSVSCVCRTSDWVCFAGSREVRVRRCFRGCRRGHRSRARPHARSRRGLRHLCSRIGSQWALISMYVAQDVLLRMSVALFALPAFCSRCCWATADDCDGGRRRWRWPGKQLHLPPAAAPVHRWGADGRLYYTDLASSAANLARRCRQAHGSVAAALSTTVASFASTDP